MSSKIKIDQSGFSNVDIILGIMIIIFVFPVLINVVQDFNIRSLSTELNDKGTIFGNTILHYVTGYRFDENYGTTGHPWTYPLGQDYGDRDDIDDFINMDWSIIPGLASSGFSASSNIYYVDPSINTTAAQAYQTNFKRIIVSVDHAELNNPIVLSTILTAHEF